MDSPALSSTLYYTVIEDRGDVMSFSIRLTDHERRLADSYARLHSQSLSEAFKQALFDRIADEFDLQVAREALTDYANDNYQSRPISELWDECDL
ncbi:antitoxin [Cutibacterium acnes subsp. defendens]|nr:antitoxin [Cutibacterium acnes subsp. defendens]